MDRAEPTAESECGVNVVFDVVGSKWKPTILWRLAEGDHRFAQLRRAVGEVSEKVLASQLRELERDGLVVRTAHDGFPLRVDYRLSEAGVELNDALDAVAEWGDRNADAIAARRRAGERSDRTTKPEAPTGGTATLPRRA